MTIAKILRSVNAVVCVWLICVILSVVWERRSEMNRYQLLRFLSLAMFCLLPATAVIDRLDAPVTWRTWIVPAATLVGVIGVWGQRKGRG
jgi:uncharacterized membrane protein